MSIKAHLEEPSEYAHEQRQNDRFYLYLTAKSELADGNHADVEIHNISAGGMLLETAHQLTKDDRLQIELPDNGVTVATVTWVGEGVYGCAFDDPINPAVLSAIQLRAEAPLPPSFRTERNASDFLGIGKKMEQARKERHLTLAQVAAELGVSKPTVWAWEKGKARPLEERLPAISNILGIDVEELTNVSGPANWSDVVEGNRQAIAAALGVQKSQIKILLDL